MSDIAIDIAHVSKVFGNDPESALELRTNGKTKAEVQAQTGQVIGLRDVSLHVEKGQIFVVMGLSGSGKSTLIRHVNRLIDPSAGRIHVNGQDVLAMNMDELRQFRRTQVAMVFQRFGLLPHRSVIDNAAYGLEVRGVSKAERLAQAADWIGKVGLAGYEQARPHELSGGQQQRVGLARALAMDTNILLMDEPFSALDPLIRSELQDVLMELQRDLKKTILFITHDFDEALKIGDRMAVLQEGEIVQTGLPQDVVLAPADSYVEAFVRDVNKARALHVSAIMHSDAGVKTDVTVPHTTRCEQVLPLFATHELIGVTNAAGDIVGHVTAKIVIAALARHQGTDLPASVANSTM